MINVKLDKTKLFKPQQYMIDQKILTINANKYRERLKEEITEIEKIQDNRNLDSTSQRLTSILTKTAREAAEQKKAKICKLKDETKRNIAKKRQLLKDKRYDDLKILRKATRKMIRKDLNEFFEEEVKKLLDTNRGLKSLRKNNHRKQILVLKDKDGKEIRNQTEMLETTEDFYENLYNKRIQPEERQQNKRIMNVGSKEIPEITKKN